MSIQISHPWARVSDFNAVMSANEKTVPLPICVSCDDFLIAINSLNFILIETVGTFFT